MLRFLFRLIILFFLLGVLYSCAEREVSPAVGDLFIKYKDLSINRPEFIEEYINSYYVETDSIDLFVTLSNKNNIIFIYNYETMELIEPIELPINGGNILGIYYENINSIYFIVKGKFAIYKFSNLKDIDCILCLSHEDVSSMIKKFDVGMYIDFGVSSLRPIYKADSTFYLPGNIFAFEQLEFQRPLFIVKIMEDDFEVNTKIGRFPKEMMKKDSTLYPFNIRFSYTRNNNNNIFSYALYDTLYVYNDTALVDMVNCKSRFRTNNATFVSVRDVNMSSQNQDNIHKRNAQYDSYFGIYYDKYNDIYYRIFKIGQKKYKSDEDFYDVGFKFTIMALDNEFNIIEEQMFDSKEFETSILVTKDGIMLRKPDDLSGITKYSIFKFNREYLKDI